MKNFFMLLAFFVLGSSLHAQFLNNLTISGTISNAAGEYIYLSELGSNTMIPVDSAKISSNNSFLISTNIEKANFFQLSNGGKQYTILILEPNEVVEIDIDAQRMLQPSKVNGSPTTMQLYNMLQKVNSYDGAMQQLNAEYQKYAGTAQQDSVGQVLSQQYEALNQQKLAYLKQEISSSPSLASLLFLDKLEIDKNLPLYVKVDKSLYAKYPDNAFVKDIHNKVESKMRLAPGSPAPEINLPDPEGNNIALSSLKGKVVLIDFWASWCSPCRRENPNNVKLYSKYKSKGFEIYGVSLDKERSNWVKAIKDDNLTWIHVSDLRYWQSVAARQYGVGSIPFTVLIDKDGKIIEVGLRGAALEQKLEQIFGE
jgi:peroxiredoxin